MSQRSIATAAARGRAGSGFTLIEVLVVLSIIGLLLAILLPAVQSAREASRRVACANNLKQIGIAVESYSSAHGGVLPKSYVGRSFYISVLPYLEQAAAYDMINMSLRHMDDPGCDTVRALRPAALTCPSDPYARRWHPASYAGNAGRGQAKFGDDGTITNISAPSVRVASITDGLSNTALAAEWLVGMLDHAGDVERTVFDVHVRKTPRLEFDAFVAKCRGLDVRAAEPGAGKGEDWTDGNLMYTLYNHIIEPGKPSCYEGGAVQFGAFTAGSEHRGAVNVLFADGRVAAVRKGIALEVWRALGSRAGGEAVSEGSY